MEPNETQPTFVPLSIVFLLLLLGGCAGFTLGVAAVVLRAGLVVSL